MRRLDEARQTLLERYLDGELTPDERARVDTLLASDPRFLREVLVYESLFAELARHADATVPGEIPGGAAAFDAVVLAQVLPVRLPVSDEAFDAPILAALLPRFSRSRMLVGVAARLYLALSLLLGVVSVSLGAVLLRPQDVEAATASGLSGIVVRVMDVFAGLGNFLLDAVVAVTGVLTPLLTALRPVINGLTSAAGAAAPAVFLPVLLVLFLAAAVLAWTTGAIRRKGLPHGVLSL